MYSPCSTPIYSLFIVNHFQLFSPHAPGTPHTLSQSLQTTLQVLLLSHFTGLETEAESLHHLSEGTYTSGKRPSKEVNPDHLFLQANSITPWRIPKSRLSRWSNLVFGRGKRSTGERIVVQGEVLDSEPSSMGSGKRNLEDKCNQLLHFNAKRILPISKLGPQGSTCFKHSSIYSYHPSRNGRNVHSTNIFQGPRTMDYENISPISCWKVLDLRLLWI